MAKKGSKINGPRNIWKVQKCRIARSGSYVSCEEGRKAHVRKSQKRRVAVDGGGEGGLL